MGIQHELIGGNGGIAVINTGSLVLQVSLGIACKLNTLLQ